MTPEERERALEKAIRNLLAEADGFDRLVVEREHAEYREDVERAWNAVLVAHRDAVAEEREACAQLVEAMPLMESSAAFAAAIRARSAQRSDAR